MRHFLETTFRPSELKVMNQALEDWRLMQRVPEGSPDLEIAAAVICGAAVMRSGGSKGMGDQGDDLPSFDKGQGARRIRGTRPYVLLIQNSYDGAIIGRLSDILPSCTMRAVSYR